jgi:hypothetical protein
LPYEHDRLAFGLKIITKVTRRPSKPLGAIGTDSSSFTPDKLEDGFASTCFNQVAALAHQHVLLGTPIAILNTPEE